MKVLIWIACVIVASIVQIFLKELGIGGAIPAMLVFGGMYGAASTLCKKYDERKARKTEEKTAHNSISTVSAMHPPKDSTLEKENSHPAVASCQKCGNSLPEDSEFCPYCGARLESQPVSETVAAPAKVILTEEQVQGIETNPTPVEPQPKAVQEVPLLRRAYSSFISADPEEKRFFEEVLGSEELRAAYLEECEKNKKEYGEGVRVDFKQSYLQFMGILHDEYFGRLVVPVTPPPSLSEKHEETPAAPTTPVETTNVPQKKNKQRYCKLCGNPIESTSKKCTGCGRQYFKAKFTPLYVLLVIVILAGGYIGANYFCAISAMNDQEFIKAQQYFDNLFVSEAVFSDKYAYVEAGVLMEEGKYIESLQAFGRVTGVPVPSVIKDSLKTKIYSAGQAAYKAGEMTEAKKNFTAISSYKRSKDYLLLIDCNEILINSGEGSLTSALYANVKYDKLKALIGFENADEIILENKSTAKLFLEGRWEDGNKNPYYFELYQDSDGWHSRYNLPRKETEGYFYLSNAIYSVGETEENTVRYYKFTIINEDTISVYCYKDGSTHKLYRQ